ncbi:hypothetical protein ACFC1L_39950 [Streptomyces sp. NPDC056210]|uniref:hypothetical protein n=1 Tax=Streptomyces sp. NPDC056210 TaxID=3345746 RepID=UPI0035DB509D
MTMDMDEEAVRFNAMEFDATSNELFDSPWSTRVLGGELSHEYGTASDQTDYNAFWESFDREWTPWVRGVICKALSFHGITLSNINRRKS